MRIGNFKYFISVAEKKQKSIFYCYAHEIIHNLCFGMSGLYRLFSFVTEVEWFFSRGETAHKRIWSSQEKNAFSDSGYNDDMI